ncbi:MAG: universal stress protein [Cyclobacteriaceae bacterium]
MISNIVVPIDFSFESRSALKTATDIARIWNAKIHLIKVCETTEILNYHHEIQRQLDADFVTTQQVYRTIKKVNSDKLEAMASAYIHEEIEWESHVLTPDQKNDIHSYMDGLDAQLIITGSDFQEEFRKNYLPGASNITVDDYDPNFQMELTA